MSLGQGAASFRTWRWSDLPTAWQVPPSEESLRAAAADLDVPVTNLRSYVCVELPDFPWAFQCQAWHEHHNHERTEEDPVIHVMVVARDSFRDEPDSVKADLYRDCLRSLLTTGRPLPLWSRAWGHMPDGFVDGQPQR